MFGADMHGIDDNIDILLHDTIHLGNIDRFIQKQVENVYILKRSVLNLESVDGWITSSSGR